MHTSLFPELKLREKDINNIMSMLYTGKIELLQTYLIKEEYLSYIYMTLDKFRTTKEASLLLIKQFISYSLNLYLWITEKNFQSSFTTRSEWMWE